MKAIHKAQLITGLRGFAAMLFWIAASPILHKAGVSFKAISIGFGAYYSILALSEVPTGAWADLFGAKKSSCIGGLLQVLALLVMTFGPDETWCVVLGFSLYGLATSFISGALSSLLYADTMAEDGKSFNSNAYFSLTEKVAVISYVLASASVGFFSFFFGKGTFLISAAIYLFGVILVATKINEGSNIQQRPSKDAFIQRIREGIHGIKNSKNLKVLVPVRLLHQIESILGVLWLPWLAALGGGEQWFSIMATGAYVSRYIVNHYLSDKDRPNSFMPRIGFSLGVMGLGTTICVITHNIWFALIGMWIMAAARGAFLPAVQAVLHEEFDEKVRTTGLSIMNFTTEATVALSYFISSTFIDSLKVSNAWGISSLCFVMGAFSILAMSKPLKLKRKLIESLSLIK